MTDFRGAVRQLLATPLLSAVAVVALTVGVALTTGAFTVVRGVFYGTLPVPDPDALVTIRDVDRVGRWGLHGR